jgi:hypothetical protein
MAQQFNRAPTYNEPLSTKGNTTRDWYSFWVGLLSGQPTGLPSPVTAGQSPYTYKATQGGTLIIQGGAVSMVSFSRDGVTNFNAGQTQGLFPLSQGDLLIITYSGAPNLTFVPR